MARSQFADKFNHDDDANDYDADVRREEHPIRVGYGAVLEWVIEEARIKPDARVLDLGVGTGNLSARISTCRELVCVDVSQKMMDIAEAKLQHIPTVHWYQDDLLAFMSTDQAPFDAVISTYAIHHLTNDEKGQLFQLLYSALKKGGVAVFGDLMFADARARDAYLAQCREGGQGGLAADIEDEFFWDVSLAVEQLTSSSFAVECKQFSALSWGICVEKL